VSLCFFGHNRTVPARRTPGPRQKETLKLRLRASALIRPAHDLHGRFNMAPLLRLLVVALLLARHRLLRGLGDRLKTVLLEHLARDRVNLHLRDHVALLAATPFRKATSGL